MLLNLQYIHIVKKKQNPMAKWELNDSNITKEILKLLPL